MDIFEQFSNQLKSKTVTLILSDLSEDYLFNLTLFLTSLGCTDIQTEGFMISFTPTKR